jgi:hypothetical protein
MHQVLEPCAGEKHAAVQPSNPTVQSAHSGHGIPDEILSSTNAQLIGTKR